MKIFKYQIIKKLKNSTLTALFLIGLFVFPCVVHSQTLTPRTSIRTSTTLFKVKLDNRELAINEIVFPEILSSPRTFQNAPNFTATNLILKKIISRDKTLYDWFRDYCDTGHLASGRSESFKDITVISLPSSSNGWEGEWIFRGGYPVKYQTSLIEGKMIESLEIRIYNWERLK